MASTTTQIVQTETTAVTRARTVAACARPAAVTAHGYRVNGTGTNATRTFASAGTWSPLAIRKPMSKVDFHDRWPLRPTL